MTTWTVEREGARTTFQVVEWRNGERVLEPRRTLTGLSCITARVIRSELESAYVQGAADVRASIYEALGD